MQFRKVLLVLVLTIAFSAITVPRVRAQSTSITDLQAPPTATVGADVMVIVGITYELGSAYAVSAGISEIGVSQWVTGSATSSQFKCGTGPANLAFCAYAPTSKSGSDVVTFDLKLSSIKTYMLRVYVQLYDQTTHSVITGATTTQDFSIAVQASSETFTSVTTQPSSIEATVSQTATQIYSTSTPSLQMPQVPQTTNSQQTDNTPLLALALTVVAVVILGGLFLYSKRKGQPKVTKAKKVDSKTKKTKASGKNFCIECGSELPLKAKFCNNCGAKQP